MTSANGCLDSLIVEDIFSYGNQIGPYSTVVEELNCAPFHVEFQAFAPSDTYFTYFWDFNDGFGVPAGDVSVSHDYLSAGSYCPQLIMTDPNGCEVFVPCENPIVVNDFSIGHNIPTAMCFGDSAAVILSNGDTYTWNNNQFVEPGTTASEFIIYPTQTTDFIVTGVMGDCESIDTIHVVVHDLPVVTLDLPEQVCFGAPEITLSGGYPQGDGAFYSADGSQIQAFNPSMNDSAWYVVHYTYQDSNTCVNSASDSIFIRPLPLVSLGDFAPLCANSDIVELAGGSPLLGVYTMGDSVVTSFDPTIGAGLYNVEYTFTDSLGCVSSSSNEILVNAVPTISLSYSATCANTAFELINTSSVEGSEIQSTEWTFGSNQPLVGQTPGQVWLTDFGVNNFHVKITSMEGCVAEMDTSVYVHAVPQAVFSPIDACAGTLLEFVSESQIEEGLIASTQWIILEETVSENDTLIYAFDDWGVQGVSLLVQSDYGCLDTLTQQVNVFPLPELSVFSNDVCLGETSFFTSATNIAYGSIVGYQWMIGDSILDINSGEASFLFDHPGAFTAHLTAQSDLGCVVGDSVGVYVNNGPEVEFTTEQNGYCPDSDVYLFDLSSIDSPGSIINEWAWYFDGELVSTEANPIIHLLDPASYDVTLIATTNTGCSGELTLDNFITVYPKPIAGFVVENSNLTMANPFVEVINTSSNDVTSWSYDFGDGVVENFENGIHEYADWTSYSITQTVSNVFGCTDTAGYEVSVFPSIIINIPNAFTPDGNGHNDLFFPVLYGSEILHFEFDIYDRWGRLMYKAASTEDGWDGTIRETGEMAPCGVYNWKMSIRTVDQPLMKTSMGSVVLIK